MILDKEVEIIIGSHNYKHFKELGYPVENKGQKLLIKTEHILSGSSVTIRIKCDIDGCKDKNKESSTTYQSYIINTKNMTELYYCKKCCTEKKRKTKLKNFGNENFMNVEKIKQTKLKKYGDENYNNRIKAEETCINKFGKKNAMQCKKIVDKGKERKKELYGDENYNNRTRFKQTCLDRFGVNHPFKNEKTREKSKQTMIKNHGVKHAFQNKEIHERYKKTMIDKYGKEHPSQISKFHEKAQTNAFKLKTHEQTGLKYRGKNELHFLDFCCKYNVKIEKASSINYKFKNKKRVYHPDFYLKDKNLIIEIKSTYTMNDDYEENIEKQNYCLKQGYNFIFIIDKNYDEFLKEICQ